MQNIGYVMRELPDTLVNGPLNEEEHKAVIDLLQHNCIEGKVIIHHKGVMVDSDLETIHTVVPSSII
jgi:hypothetical protein